MGIAGTEVAKEAADMVRNIIIFSHGMNYYYLNNYVQYNERPNTEQVRY